MNEIIEIKRDVYSLDMLNPAMPLFERTKEVITVLYNKAVQLIKQEYETEPMELAPWKLLSDEQLQIDSVENLTPEEQDWAIQYHHLVDSKVMDIAEALSSAVRGAVAEVTTMRARKLLRFQKIKGYDNVKEAAKHVLNVSPDTSTGRQIESFLNNHLPVIEEAGVPESVTLEVVAKNDKTVLNVSRAISRTQKDVETTPEQKQEKVREIMEFAAETEKASDIRREFINGQHMQIPRDVVQIDGDTLVTFLCRDEHEFSTLDRKTESISVSWGNAQPILAETQAKRTRQEVIFDLGLVISILQSGNYTMEEISAFMKTAPVDILTKLVDCGIVEYGLDGKYSLKVGK